MNRTVIYMRLIVAIVAAAALAACASMGRPEGGPIDETPPVFVRSTPRPGAVNVERDRITIEFDENVQLKDAMNKVVVSPAQKTMPKISAAGRRVTINLMDSLQPNTTYTIDFTDAISDLNEGNELDGFAFDFATGPTIDTLAIAGMVFEAENLEPAQGMLVGVHSNLSDTALTKVAFDRITKINQLGQFVIRNLKPGTYRIFAINDVNRDNKWDRTEDIAFYDTLISPTASRKTRTDTLKAADGTDSIAETAYTAYAPDDVLLTWFNEKYKAQYMSKYERKQRNKIYFEMGAPSDSFPELTITGGEFDGMNLKDLSVLKSSATRDTLEYWLTDRRLIDTDSLFIAARYLKTDSTDNLSWTTDTLSFVFRDKKKNTKKEKEKEKDKEKKQSSDTTDTVPPKVELLKITPLIQGTAEVYSPLRISTETPLSRFDSNAVHLHQLVDSNWVEVEITPMALVDTLNPLIYGTDVKWTPGEKYKLTIDSLGMTGIYDISNGPVTAEFTVRPLEDYSSINFNITGLPTDASAVAQLLNNQDKPVRSEPVNGGVAAFRHIQPGTYYARLFVDRNGNGLYDGGNVADSIQPEEVYYFSKKLSLKKNWDINQPWDINELPIDQQKPLDIKKNKPKKKRGEEDMMNPDDEDDQYYDEFGNPSVDPDDPFGKRKGRNYNRTNRDQNAANGRAGYRGSGSLGRLR